MAASAEFLASLSLSGILAWVPVIGRLRFCRQRRRTSLERFLNSSVHVAFKDFERGHTIILKLNCFNLCTLGQAARIMPSNSVLRFI